MHALAYLPLVLLNADCCSMHRKYVVRGSVVGALKSTFEKTRTCEVVLSINMHSCEKRGTL